MEASSGPSQMLRLILGVFSAVLAGFLLLVFYYSPLRDTIENRLFDLRTRWKGSSLRANAVAAVEIDAATLATEVGTPDNNLTAQQIADLIGRIYRHQPKSVLFLWHPQTLAYDSTAAWPLFQILKEHPDFIVGAFTDDLLRLAEMELGDRARHQIFNAQTHRYYRREVLRTFDIKTPLVGWLVNESPEDSILRSAAIPTSRFFINYLGEYHPESTSARILKTVPGRNLQGKLVVLGYSAYRRRGQGSWESTHVNSPWQNELMAPSLGMSLVQWYSHVAENIIGDRWLRPLSSAANILQTVIFAIICIFAWRFSVTRATTVIVACMFVLLAGNCLLMNSFSAYLPLADTTIFGGLAILGGALWRVQHDAKKRLKDEVLAQAERNLAQSQHQFLQNFSLEMVDLSEQVSLGLRNLRSEFETDQTRSRVFHNALYSSEDLKEYLSSIKEFSDSEQYTGKVLTRPVDLRALVDKVVRQFESRSQAGNVELVIDLKACSANTDETLCSQILFNLVSNAIKYSPQGGKVFIRSTALDQRRISLSVKDQGPGIAQEYHSRIFQKFYRVQDDHVYRIKGNGLGLYLSKYFATRIGAQIEMNSRPGHGSEFKLLLEGCHGKSQ